ncbi:Topless-related protein 4 [Hibiscus syriacus]|uniref:Topless-related protein 4 n=1 Tax=Hibiscus syriacus TaxID=106335 RepID=A0A6A3CU30_HIBSY|nr:Topless-related protein 4 [Hibiscus syriacus]
MTTSLSRDLIFLIMQFLDEEKFKETVHILQQESGLFFSVKHFEDLILSGKWEEVEQYLSGFTKVDDNRYSMKIFFEIRKQKYLEALDKLDRAKALDILTKDLKVFSSFNGDLFKEITQLLTLDNFRENEQLSTYRDAKTARSVMLIELKKLIEANPLLCDKLQFPNIKSSRLRMLINQSLNWQHSLCPNPRQNPDIRTLMVDHSCRNSTDPYTQLAASNQLMVSAQKTEGFIPVCANGSFQPASTSVQVPSNVWVTTPSSMNHPVVSGGVTMNNPIVSGGVGMNHPVVSGGVGLGGQSNLAAVSKGLSGSDISMARVSAVPDRVMPPGMNPSQNGLQFNMAEELPKTVARTLNQGSDTTSMDFHPVQQTLLLAGTNIGDISLWEVSSREKLISRNFQVWDIGASSMALKAALIKDPSVSVRRILWSPDGSLFGVGYSKHMLQLYTYFGGNDVRQHLEIDSHVGAVNDLAFCNPSKQLSVITCGDDKTIKVWEVGTGVKLYTFEGHEAAVHSVCPHYKENVHFFFSTSVDGKIKAWLYDMMGSRVDYYAPGRSCATMAYSADGKRLFSCGTTKEGESHMVEWNENEGSFLAAGDDYSIKFWDMENCILLLTVMLREDYRPRIRFNKEGSLLAVSANENKIKILATVDGLRLMRTYETHSHIAPRPHPSDAPAMNGDSKKSEDTREKSTEEVNPVRAGQLTEISTPAQFRALKLSARFQTDKIGRLIYTNSGNAILALAFNAIHLLWKWTQNDLNLSGKATTKVTPQLVQPASGILMTNHLIEGNSVETVPCFALSKNDSYVMSASGGKISLFNMMTFKKMVTFMSPPPVATYLAFHPQDNNIIAIGMEDFTVYIYNVRLDEVKSKLKGHSKRITGLAFSHLLNVLVSSGADAQIIVWDLNNWERKNGCFLQTPAGRTPTARSDTQIQFQQDQTHLLAVNETQLAIYDVRKLECIKQLAIGESSGPITHGIFSCDSRLVYTSFMDGTVRIFSASNLQLQRQINPTAYLSSDVSSTVHPLAIAAHPQEPNQFAIGLTDGTIYVFEPLESEGKWDVAPQPQRVENGSAISVHAMSKVAQMECMTGNDALLGFALQAMVVESAIIMGMPNGIDIHLKEPEAYAGFPLAQLLAVRKPSPENKDASDTEDDDDNVDDEEAEDDQDEDAGEDGEEDDDEEEEEDNDDNDVGEDEEELQPPAKRQKMSLNLLFLLFIVLLRKNEVEG